MKTFFKWTIGMFLIPGLSSCVEINTDKQANEQIYLACAIVNYETLRADHQTCVQRNSGDPNGFCGSLDLLAAASIAANCEPPP